MKSNGRTKKEGQLTNTLPKNITIIMENVLDSHDQNGQHYDTYKKGNIVKAMTEKITKI